MATSPKVDYLIPQNYIKRMRLPQHMFHKVDFLKIF